ncbi:hypothetical protein [Rhodanobacter sp. FW106-PBR-LB-2-11]|uniref:hypothetical protein n=1 Tax=Rhodanobacter sp. FW106-PBR-LB-2-11 TaxID=1524463 RepID=UPI0034E3F3C8
MLAALLSDTRSRALIARGADELCQRRITLLLVANPRQLARPRRGGVDPARQRRQPAMVTDAEGNTPLHGAVLSADAGVTAMLLDAAAPIDALNKAGVSPLATACRAATSAAGEIPA